MPKKDRRTNQPPGEFKQFLEVFNASRKTILFQDSSFSERLFINRGKNDWIQREKDLINRIHSSHRNVSVQDVAKLLADEMPTVIAENGDFLQYVLEVSGWHELLSLDFSALYEKSWRYLAFFRSVVDFETIIDRLEMFREGGGALSGSRIELPARARVLYINEQHRMQYEERELVKLNNLDLDRLKRCDNCKKVFWVFRLGAKFCGEACLIYYHQKKLRNDKKRLNKYNERRRENYQRKKDLEEIRKKKNDTL